MTAWRFLCDRRRRAPPTAARRAAARGQDSARWVLLAPERVVKLNPIAVEILKLCDGARSLGEIVADLAERFNADPVRVGADVRGLLDSLAEKRMAEL